MWGDRSLAFVALFPPPCPLFPKFPTLDPRVTKGREGLAFGSQHQGKHLPLDKHCPTVRVSKPGVHSVWLAPRATVATKWKCHLWPEDGNSFFLTLSSFKCKQPRVSHSWCLLDWTGVLAGAAATIPRPHRLQGRVPDTCPYLDQSYGFRGLSRSSTNSLSLSHPDHQVRV